MSRVLGLFAAIQFLVVSTAAAEDLVRDNAAFELVEIQGKNQLALPAATNRCQLNSASSGTCQVQDAVTQEDENIRYTLQILTTMRMASITRTKELR